MVNNYSKRWKPIHLVRIYRLLKAGLNYSEVCREIGVTLKCFAGWQIKHPELKQVLELVKKENSDSESLPEWVWQRLSPELKAIWKVISDLDGKENGIARIEAVLADHGKRVRQQLFLHALCVFNFNPSSALKKVNLTKKELDRWITNDPGFAELVDEIEYHKGNFFESALVKLVKEGNPAAILFANKTYNNDRGYTSTSKLQVEHSGSVLHGVLDLNELTQYLSDSAKLELLTAIRANEEAKKITYRQLTPVEVMSKQIAGETVDADNRTATGSGGSEG